MVFFIKLFFSKELTKKRYIMLQKKSISNKCCPFHQIIINVHISQNFPHDFYTIINQHSCFEH